MINYKQVLKVKGIHKSIKFATIFFNNILCISQISYKARIRSNLTELCILNIWKNINASSVSMSACSEASYKSHIQTSIQIE